MDATKLRMQQPIKEPITKDSEFMDAKNRHVTKRLD